MNAMHEEKVVEKEGEAGEHIDHLFRDEEFMEVGANLLFWVFMALLMGLCLREINKKTKFNALLTKFQGFPTRQWSLLRACSWGYSNKTLDSWVRARVSCP